MSALGELLARRIRATGPITVAEYMAEALGHPRHGYYMTRDPFGVSGDFITGPEISQMFGELLGLWAAEVWRLMGAPGSFRLVELGPGRGTLMADAWRAARIVPGFRGAASVHLVESSPRLAACQRERLADVPAAWHDRFIDVPGGPMILIANEFFDALPAHVLERTVHGWRERLVTVEGGRFCLRLAPGPTPATEIVPPAAADAPVGAVVEIQAAGLAMAAAVARRIADSGGAALVIDYGPAHGPEGPSLQAVKGHRPCEVFAEPGEADLTVHVDFQSLADAAGPKVAVNGPVAQGAFLQQLGIEARATTLLARATAEQAKSIRAALHRLTSPDEMGSLFKAMALAHRALPLLPGFAP